MWNKKMNISMKIKRIINVFMFALAVTICSQLTFEHAVFAQDVWAFSSRWGDDYVMTETIKWNGTDIELNIKAVKDENVKIHPIVFRTQSMTWCGMTGTGMRDLGEIKSSPYASAIWKVVKQYI